MVRTIDVKEITEKVSEMCIRANSHLPSDVEQCIKSRAQIESDPSAKDTLEKIIENISIAKTDEVPLCQDTGFTVVFLEIGQDVHLIGGDVHDAVNEGVRQGYEKGYLRKSVVGDPLQRVNTGDNTPAVINIEIVPGDKVRIMVAPKGFGSENMSRMVMLPPSAGRDGVVNFILETVTLAGANPCPPIIVGVGIGGTFDRAPLLAKKALMRPTNVRHPDPYYAQLEEELLEKINKLGIGPQAFGGDTTALAVNIEHFATHIAGLPVAVNINCHVARHVEEII